MLEEHLEKTCGLKRELKEIAKEDLFLDTLILLFKQKRQRLISCSR